MDEVHSTPIWVIVAIAAANAACVFLSPRLLRMRNALASMCVVMTLARLVDLGAIALAAKIASGWSLVLVAVAAWLHPAQKTSISLWNLFSLAAAVLGCFAVAGAEDWFKAIAFRFQALVATVAAILIAQKITDHRSLLEPFIGITLGVALGVALSLSCLLVDPVGAYIAGYGRLSPYGCNPVQMGVLYLTGAVLALLFTLEKSHEIPTWLAAGIAFLSILGAVLTVSRMAVGGIVIASSPVVFRLIRRPVYAIGLIAFLLAIIPWAFSGLGEANLDHLEASRDSHRIEYMQEVLDEVYQRPWFGLMFAEDIKAHDSELNAHNAYIEIMFLGGMAFAGPSLLVYAVAFSSAGRALWTSFGNAGPGVLARRTLAIFYWLLLANGCITFINNYATFVISFVHCLLTQHYLMPSHRVAGRRRVKKQAGLDIGRSAKRSVDLQPHTVLAKREVRRDDRSGVHSAPQGVSSDLIEGRDSV